MSSPVSVRPRFALTAARILLETEHCNSPTGSVTGSPAPSATVSGCHSRCLVLLNQFVNCGHSNNHNIGHTSQHRRYQPLPHLSFRQLQLCTHSVLLLCCWVRVIKMRSKPFFETQNLPRLQAFVLSCPRPFLHLVVDILQETHRLCI